MVGTMRGELGRLSVGGRGDRGGRSVRRRHDHLSVRAAGHEALGWRLVDEKLLVWSNIDEKLLDIYEIGSKIAR
jgi:hypothetical protein